LLGQVFDWLGKFCFVLVLFALGYWLIEADGFFSKPGEPVPSDSFHWAIVVVPVAGALFFPTLAAIAGGQELKAEPEESSNRLERTEFFDQPFWLRAARSASVVLFVGGCLLAVVLDKNWIGVVSIAASYVSDFTVKRFTKHLDPEFERRAYVEKNDET